MTARRALAGYTAAMLLGTTLHRPAPLALGLLAVLLLAGRQWSRVARRAALAVLLFNGVVTVSYVVVAATQGTFSPQYVLLLNLRVMFLTCLTFLFVARVNVFEAFAFSRDLTYLFTLAFSQAMLLQRVVADFRLALRSRSIRPASLPERYRQSAGAGLLLLDKSMHSGTEITEAMRSRGFFDD